MIVFRWKKVKDCLTSWDKKIALAENKQVLDFLLSTSRYAPMYILCHVNDMYNAACMLLFFHLLTQTQGYLMSDMCRLRTSD